AFLHLYSPSPALAQFGNQSRRQVLGGEREGLPLIRSYVAAYKKACATHGLEGGASCLPSRPVSEYLTVKARLNSVVASTLPRTERAGVRRICEISPFKTASAFSPLVTWKVPSCCNCLITVSVTSTSIRGTSVPFLKVGTAMVWTSRK